MKPNRGDSLIQKKRVEDELFSAIVNFQTVDSLGDFFRDLCTPAELQALVDRWQVVKLLQQDLSYRRIHDLPGVSVTTIGRVARFLTDGFGGYAAALDSTSTIAKNNQDSRSH